MKVERLNVGNLDRPDLQKLCKERGLHAGKKATKLELQLAPWAFEEDTRMQSQLKDSEDEDPNVGSLKEGELDLEMENDLAVCPEQELPEETFYPLRENPV
ncbi:hypothetical protein NDU88_003977 [Pleurodeles waltl]|uniref:Uncharacterized protein n=1 Tax=Pleurodeles waltl TaxID=8319 RepID=A0AAV7W3N2_PLEWA|nr:hypothetical protein NDU88_003977 [Pleurodeles waltl]